MSIAAGTRLGPYEILAPLGAGGMGEVYRARDTRLGRELAVKVLPPDFAGDAQRRSRFEQEARSASALNHPNIVVVHDVGVAGDHLYVAMELVDGKTLREILETSRLPVSRGLEIGTQIAEGLARAHAAGIVHRDLKPENVMISKDGHVKILDFGLAKITKGAGDDVSNMPTAAPLPTDAGTVMGTVGYMSPEQAAGRPVDFRSDQFSLGTILYEMATGKRPFQRETAAQTMSAIIAEDAEPIAALNPRVPPPLRWIVDRCLGKEPEARYASTTDLARELKSLRDHLSEATSAAVSAGVPAAKRARRPVAAIAAALVVVAAVAALLSNRLTLDAHPATVAPIFHRLTFGRGTIWGARFAPDGGTIVYSAAWNGDKPRLFTVREDNLFSTQLALPPAILFGMSSQSELALGREPTFFTTLTLLGTLARSPLSGGAPRDLEERVAFSDWTPDGQSLAVARDIGGGRFGLFYPEDHLLYESLGWVSHLRFSPDGKQIAFLDHPPSGDSGDVLVVPANGKEKARKLAGDFVTVQGLAWRPDGKEVWVTGTRTGIARSLEAISLAGKERTVCRVPATFTIYDLLKDGRALVAEDDYRSSIFFVGKNGEQKDLSALDWAGPGGISPDGSLVSFDETGEGGGDKGALYIRKTDASPPVLLGTGAAGGFSSDGRWVAALSFDGTQISVYPTGPGKARTYPLTLVGSRPQFVAGDKEICFRGFEKGRLPQLYALDLATGKTRQITEQGVGSSTYLPVSPDGRTVFAITKERQPALYSVDGKSPRPVPGAEPGDAPAGWSTDGASVYVYRRGETPMHIFRVELASGKRTPWKEISPPDPGGITGVAPVIVGSNGDSYVYGATRILSTLYLVEGLK
ncbi:MAG TPA: protein kinase [Thermoanaerobaculia bacterium]|nr:protein kinase [Thermoanaerobaculia bacterium]